MQQKMHYEPEQQSKLKIIIVGDSGVGKTNVRNRFCHGVFDPLSESTVGIQYSRRKLWAQIQGKNRLITACFWDAAGKTNQNQLLPSFFKNIIGVIYVFDLTKSQSLQNLRIWKSLVKDHMNVNKVVQMIIGNKNDLVCFRQVNGYEVEKYKKELKIQLYYETSSLLNINIQEAFYAYLNELARSASVGLRRPVTIPQKEISNRCYN